MTTALVWLRNDLRLADNPALFAAVSESDAVAPVFIWAPGESGLWSPGPATRAWLALSLKALARSIDSRGGRLLIAAGQTGITLLALAAETGATTVHWNQRYEPALTELDSRVRDHLEAAGLRVVIHSDSLLREPSTLLSTSGRPYRVFTPFMNASERGSTPAFPLPAPGRIPAPIGLREAIDPASVLPTSGDAPDIAAHWTPGEAGATARADRFFSDLADVYAHDRDWPGIEGTSKLSPHLAFGEISPRTLWHRAQEQVHHNGSHRLPEGTAAFVRQLQWREFAYHLVHHFPETTERPLRRRFEIFPWSRDPVAFEAWEHGMTGFPMVDAGMREMLATGWMHNRVRMLVASFLTKDLLLPWLDGARSFWEHLADADLPNNTLGWQWVAGCGADAAPYFRVFNPVAQGEKFDPDGRYVKRWVPELEGLSPEWIHRPWAAPSNVLASAGVVLGARYPQPIVDHAAARLRALAIYGSMRDVVE
ncbi:MAG: deoxyribodipyrimidine photo-lyase [Actinomycetota bacterium]|nr:deoxyribodipyrimidine photo-lyase [Actinomycetota bacterium]MDP3630928.1 deoxyribodipyrimidine photo-lyase [Actinomycetota bacterium]